MTLNEFFNSLLERKSGRRRRLATRRSQTPASMATESLENRSLLTSLIGAEVTVTATFESTLPGGTGGIETPVGTPQHVTVEQSVNDPEIVRLAGSWSIDIDGDRIAIAFDHDPAVTPDPTGMVPDGTYYRFYFNITGLGDREFISSVSPDTTRNLIPSARLTSPSTILVEIGPGAELTPVSNATINVGVDTLPHDITGRPFTVRSTFESALGTSGVEIPDAGPVTAQIENTTEVNSFGGLFDIDVSNTGIAMRFNPDPTMPDPSRVIEAGTWYRYYFDFDLGTNVFVQSAQAVPSQNLVPNVRLEQSGQVVVEIGPGMQLGTGFDALIQLQIAVTGSTVSGQKWNDQDYDGVRDPGEPFLNGWRIQLKDLLGQIVATTTTRNIDMNSDGVIDPETERGVYQFEAVQDGSYVVEEILKDGWVPSHPASPVDELAWQLKRTHNLRPAGRDFLNWGGLNERWLYGNGNWFYITPDGTFYMWDGSSPRTSLAGTQLARLNTEVYQNLTLLYNAAPPARNTADVTVPDNVTDLNFGNYLPAPEFTLQEIVQANDHVLDINWTEVAPNLRYNIWITDIHTRRRFGDVHTVTGNNFQITLPERRYRVWIRTEAGPDVWSAWSRSQQIEFFHDAVMPITSGLDAGIDATPTISWDTLQVPPAGGVAGAIPLTATSYDVRVTDAGGSVEYLATGVRGTTHRIATILSLGEHYVSIRGNYSDGSRNAWSAGQRLLIDGQPKVQLVNGVLTWTAVKAATEYEVWVDMNDDQGNRLARQVIYSNNVRDLMFQLPGNLRRGRYAAWIRAIRSEGGAKYFSYWSSRRDFVVDRLGIADAGLTELPQTRVRMTHAEDSPDSDQPSAAPVSVITDREDGTQHSQTPDQRSGDASAVADADAAPLAATVMAEVAERGLLLQADPANRTTESRG